MPVTPLNRLGQAAIARKGWLGAHRFLLARRFSQLGILGLFMLPPVAGMHILKGDLASSLLFETIPLSDPLVFAQLLAAGFLEVAATAAIGAALLAAFYLAVGGRVFCAWVCPLNMLTDATHRLRRRLGIRGGARLSGGLRYWMLAMVLVLALVTGSLAWELVNPVTLAVRGLVFGLGFGWAIVLGIVVFDLLVVRHGWCGHLCPVGAFYGVLGEAALLRVSAHARAACDDCMDCYAVCPEPHVIAPALKGARNGHGPLILAGDCLNCGRCIDVCSENVFRFTHRFDQSLDDGRVPSRAPLQEQGG